ncbi:hypothetical protein MY10362_007696 [Beauveria mimosiformis]
MDSSVSSIATPPASARAQRSQALDDLIMGTNSSSIVSKRSVERLYYPDEPHYFRYFVKKFQRRAPLINRGDVLPWQSNIRYGDKCSDALFIDIDYADLMHRKRAVVLETPQLKELLGSSFEVSKSDKDIVLLKSERYCQIGCDLRDLQALRHVLETLADLSESPVLFVAEVSVTYMDTESADRLLAWASSVGKAEFCLLEQILPYGRGHPFAQTMLLHFDKLKTPPRSVGCYPTINDQSQRFKSRGWPSVRIWDLWDAWSCGEFVNAQERVALDDIEPFDEWEEFMLFARHYFVLHASAIVEEDVTKGKTDIQLVLEPTIQPHKVQPCHELSMQFTTFAGSIKRRFGALATLQDVEGRKFVLNMMGLGSNAREDRYDIYSLDGGAAFSPPLPLTGPSPRMCCTVTDLGSYGILLAGGRGSPASALSDCWLLRKDHGWSWQSTWKLPLPLYRHSALRLAGTSLVLVAGGKISPSRISEYFFVLNPEKGWLQCKIAGDIPKPSFGSVLCNSPVGSSDGKPSGLLCGGIEASGLLAKKKYEWTLDIASKHPTITFAIMNQNFAPELSIFGASCVEIQGNTLICGGIGADQANNGQAMYCLTSSESKVDFARITQRPDDAATKPFMIGTSVLYNDDRIVIAGGGATCFSMGTFWETKVYQAQVPTVFNSGRVAADGRSMSTEIKLISSQRVISSTSAHRGDSELGRPDAKARISTIARLSLSSETDFEDIILRGQPVVIENLQLGDCLKKWTVEYMTERVGSGKKVVVHECQPDDCTMNFTTKNFRYITDDFATILARASNGERLYLRSLSNEKPAEQPAKLEDDFPDLATDFILPRQLDYVNKKLFSSVLRVSGKVNMWLHYDVMANVYAQIIGTKRMMLFPPSDVAHLAFAPGASSSSVDVFTLLETPKLAHTRPHEAIVGPGDVLFLPPLWLHTATPTTDMSIAVNTFFRDLDGGYATGRDVYGNRDLAAYEKGRQEVAKIAKQFQELPEETRKFYLASLLHTAADMPAAGRLLRRMLLPGAAVTTGAVLVYSYRPRNIPGHASAAVPPPTYALDGSFTMPRFPRVKSRQEQLDALRLSGSDSTDDEYDMLVIGGGATGAGVALDAVTRGLRVAVVERDDFSSGTSSKSTKLVHGGVRYLEKAVWNLDYNQYKLVREALTERKYFLQTAPHLSMWLPIMLPLDKWWKAPYYWAGTKFYDVLAGSEGIESSYFLTRSKALEAFPMLKQTDLVGALVYYDGAHNDSRMNVSIAMTAALYGATVANHTEVTGLLKDDNGHLCGAKIRDNIAVRNGKPIEDFTVRAKCVVNCTGPFTDAIRKMDDESCKEIVAPSSGVHVILPGYYSPGKMGLLDPSTSDGRVIFFLPWQGNTIAGTTDSSCAITPNPVPDEESIKWILDEIRGYLSPEIRVRRGDVLAAWSGIRPLVKDPKAKNTESLVRNHLTDVSRSGLLTCAGGKWTTYRQMAEDCVDVAVKEFGLNTKAVENAPRVSGTNHIDDGAILDGKCQTHNVRLIGAHGFSKTLFIPLIQYFGVETKVAKHLTESYGDRAWSVATLCKQTTQRFPARGERISQLYPFVDGEVRYACRHEYAQTPVDILARRTRLAFLSAQAALEALPKVIDIMAEELTWDHRRQEREWDDTVDFLKYMGLPQPLQSATRKQVEQGKLDFASSLEWNMYSRHDKPQED